MLQNVIANEVWKPVAGFEGLYEVSDQGRVRSLSRQVPKGAGYKWIKGVVLKNLRHTGGYARVMLWKDGAAKQTYIHKLVLEAFVGPRPEGHQGAHNNGDKQDNRLANLRWATPSENQADRETHGTGRVGVARRTRDVGAAMAKLIRKVHGETGLSVTELARQLCLPRTTVGDVINGRTWNDA